MIPGFNKRRQEDYKFETSLGYKGRPCLRKKIMKADNGKVGRAGTRWLLWVTYWLWGIMGVIHILAKVVCGSLPELHDRE